MKRDSLVCNSLWQSWPSYFIFIKVNLFLFLFSWNLFTNTERLLNVKYGGQQVGLEEERKML